MPIDQAARRRARVQHSIDANSDAGTTIIRLRPKVLVCRSTRPPAVELEYSIRSTRPQTPWAGTTPGMSGARRTGPALGRRCGRGATPVRPALKHLGPALPRGCREPDELVQPLAVAAVVARLPRWPSTHRGCWDRSTEAPVSAAPRTSAPNSETYTRRRGGRVRTEAAGTDRRKHRSPRPRAHPRPTAKPTIAGGMGSCCRRP